MAPLRHRKRHYRNEISVMNTHRGISTFILSFILSALASEAAEYHVTTSGDDTSNGSVTTPWRTLAQAAAQATAGDVVIVHEGLWNEALRPAQSGTVTHRITFRAATGTRPIISGTGLSVDESTGVSGLIDLSDRSYVRVEGFLLQDFVSNEFYETPVGILVEGSSVGLEIVDNVIERIQATATPQGSGRDGRNAHGIAVYGRNATPISNILILNNTLSDLTLGSSEAIVLNGNIDGFLILENVVYNCDNIGIDVIGFEEGSPYQARNGTIAGNLVHHCSSNGNPSYPPNESSAGGIYVDGGTEITIARNHVHHCDIGIELASENPGKATSNITVRSNLITDCTDGGVFLGGYDENPASMGGGSTSDCAILHNTLVDNDTNSNPNIGCGPICLQFRVLDCTIANNLVSQSITEDSQYNMMIVQGNTTGANLIMRNNLFYGPDTPVWIVNDEWLEGWTDYQSANVSADDLFGNPNFPVDGYLPAVSSNAIDGGSLSYMTAGERDHAGNARLAGTQPDCGCFERNSVQVAAPEPEFADIPGLPSRVIWKAPLDGFASLQQSTDLTKWQSIPGVNALTVDGNQTISPSARQFYRVILH